MKKEESPLCHSDSTGFFGTLRSGFILNQYPSLPNPSSRRRFNRPGQDRIPASPVVETAAVLFHIPIPFVRCIQIGFDIKLSSRLHPNRLPGQLTLSPSVLLSTRASHALDHHTWSDPQPLLSHLSTVLGLSYRRHPRTHCR